MTAPRLAAVGAGRMGRSIAAAVALAGEGFTLIDLRQRSADDSRRLRNEVFEELDAIFARMRSFGRIDASQAAAARARVALAGHEDAPAALAAADMLFEAVPETVEAKRECFAFACRHLPEDAIVASTSSTMLAGELAGMVREPRRFLNAHWLNPAYLIPLVEVSPHAGTEPAVLNRTIAALESVGKVPVVCGDSPGYIVPRLQVLVMNEAARMIEQGLATPEDIDKAIRHGFGPRYASMGVAEFIDFGGVDILYHASRYMSDRLADDRYACPAIIADKMNAGELGMKTGRGLYDWDAGRAERFQRESMARMARILELGDAGHS